MKRWYLRFDVHVDDADDYDREARGEAKMVTYSDVTSVTVEVEAESARDAAKVLGERLRSAGVVP